MNIYLELTREFNAGRVRAIVSSGQAVVLHRLAIMSKDGDWIVREDPEALEHILRVLEQRGARYRFGAPLDERWLAGGWSAHFEFRTTTLRVRADFVSRPPRLTPGALAKLWQDQAARDIPVVGARELAELKKTNREKDYAVIGELARQLTDPAEELRLSRSARDLQALARAHPDLVEQLRGERPVLAAIATGLTALEVTLDAERRALMHANEERLRGYEQAAARWADAWPDLQADLADRPLREAHALVAQRAAGVLPFRVAESAS